VRGVQGEEVAADVLLDLAEPAPRQPHQPQPLRGLLAAEVDAERGVVGVGVEPLPVDVAVEGQVTAVPLIPPVRGRDAALDGPADPADRPAELRAGDPEELGLRPDGPVDRRLELLVAGELVGGERHLPRAAAQGAPQGVALGRDHLVGDLDRLGDLRAGVGQPLLVLADHPVKAGRLGVFGVLDEPVVDRDRSARGVAEVLHGLHEALLDLVLRDLDAEQGGRLLRDRLRVPGAAPVGADVEHMDMEKLAVIKSLDLRPGLAGGQGMEVEEFRIKGLQPFRTPAAALIAAR
jgi:hypothetical protein